MPSPVAHAITNAVYQILLECMPVCLLDIVALCNAGGRVSVSLIVAVIVAAGAAAANA